VRADLSWLQDVGLVRCEILANGSLWMATLTKRGEECADGRVKVPGVKRAGPKE
jgi:hypothetical protein